MKTRIYRPSKSAMQSGTALTHAWVLEYVPETPRRPEPLMGWTQSGDTLNQVKMHFPTQAAAVEFAVKKGWDYDVEEPHSKHIPPKNYAQNFVARKGKATT